MYVLHSLAETTIATYVPTRVLSAAFVRLGLVELDGLAPILDGESRCSDDAPCICSAVRHCN